MHVFLRISPSTVCGALFDGLMSPLRALIAQKYLARGL